MQHIGDLHHDHQPGDQQQVAAFVAGDLQGQQGGHVGDAEHGDHQAPLHFRGAFQEVLTVAAQRGQNRQQQEHIDRNEDREQPVPVNRNQHVLQRQRQVKRRHQGRVIAAPGWRERQELAQGVERHGVEQQDDRALTQPEGEADHQHHHPPGIDARVEVVDNRVGSACPALEHVADQRGEQQDHADAHEQQLSLVIHYSGSGARASSASRLRVRNCSLLSSLSRRRGAPKLVVHNSGNGNMRPLGMTRLRLAIHTGTRSTCG